MEEYSPKAASPAAAAAIPTIPRSSSTACGALGFRTLLPDDAAGADHRHVPHAGDPKFVFQTFYDRLKIAAT